MYSLIWGLINEYFKCEDVKILIVGLDGSGKTTILEMIRYVFNNISNTSTSISNRGRQTSSESSCTVLNNVRDDYYYNYFRSHNKPKTRPNNNNNNNNSSNAAIAPNAATAPTPYNTGKVSTAESSTHHFSLIDTSKITPTIGFNKVTIRKPNNRSISITFWDLGGSECIRSIWTDYYSSVDGIIYVVDAHNGDVEYIRTNRQMINKLIRHENLVDVKNGGSRGRPIPFFIIANKQDLIYMLNENNDSRTLDSNAVTDRSSDRSTIGTFDAPLNSEDIRSDRKKAGGGGFDEEGFDENSVDDSNSNTEYGLNKNSRNDNDNSTNKNNDVNNINIDNDKGNRVLSSQELAKALNIRPVFLEPANITPNNVYKNVERNDDYSNSMGTLSPSSSSDYTSIIALIPLSALYDPIGLYKAINNIINITLNIIKNYPVSTKPRNR